MAEEKKEVTESKDTKELKTESSKDKKNIIKKDTEKKDLQTDKGLSLIHI